ncbi:MAG: tetratricopeptide repeat protein, partial [Thermodesulfobacteriota bacterium]
ACDLHEKGSLQEAVELYHKLLAFLPESPLLHFNCGLALYELQDFQEAAPHYQLARLANPEDPDIFYNQGLNYRALGEMEEAVLSFEQAIQLGDNSVDSLYNLALCYQDLDNRNEAGRLYERILADFPGHQSSLNNYAYLCHKSGELKKALALYKKLLEENPEHASARHMLNSISGKGASSAPLSYVEEVFDNYADNFEQSLLEKLKYRTPGELFKRYRLLFGDGPVKSCLDLGCGTGLAGELFAPSCQELTGVDISAEMLNVAEEKEIYSKLVKDDIVHFLQESSAPYDLILAADVFTYLGELEEIFTACLLKSKAGGLFLFSVEESSSNGCELKASGRFGHSADYIQELCRESGWNLLDCHPSKLRQDKGEWIKGFLYTLQK